ncbi:hypothetical protein SERLA73DRAFT_181308 [Serpula lacrymans var. lacrymans S7.3]|uniref:Ser-Thr-rich glycosyl-phosphatidyl-inositol-anchored membrane family-domain-containing protein n=2 Tax=Serpula lacrymans var. lacrymans TaxID=341189 RepID=F8PXU3_SERL3|nr:uncharacterized protein SERLADRAFT_467399 [Serpula lacrymans var. lacrymans S7.9]EGN98706.1 hypothetical protein SERLA73DRAFT_181308 [Serpula lacrymans var. lacrymans S7.3]EGO24310.1 hypothetical protein SERLADRAFT_467399 [Serpula lacrymans var. lacrymans S7.9]
MKSFTFVAALISVLPAVLGLTINTPSNVVVCEPQQFTWSGGAAPYYLSLVPGGQSMASPIKQFPTQSGTAYTWNVDLQAGTTFNIALKDSTGATAYSDIVTIQSGGSTSCVNTSVQEGSATAGSAPPATGGSSPATGGSRLPPPRVVLLPLVAPRHLLAPAPPALLRPALRAQAATVVPVSPCPLLSALLESWVLSEQFFSNFLIYQAL